MKNGEFDFAGTGFHQGDTQFFKLNSLPGNVKKINPSFIAASERSGSFHALFGNYEMYEVEDKSGFVIDAKEECILNHSLKSVLEAAGVSLSNPEVLPKKDHRHTVVPAGIYFVGIQQKFDPLANAKVNVKD